MKLRRLALSAVLLTLSYAAPQSWAQDQGSVASKDQPTSNSAAKSSAPEKIDAADPEAIERGEAGEVAAEDRDRDPGATRRRGDGRDLGRRERR